jgi:hypothetical protein
MPGVIVNDIKQLIFEAIYRNLPFDMGPTLQIGLSTTQPYYDGTNFTEPVGMGYARLDVPASEWEVPDTYGHSANNTAFTFAAATGTWGEIGWAGVFEVVAPELRERRKKFLPTTLHSQVDQQVIPIVIHDLSEIIFVSNGVIVEFNAGDFRFGPWQ